MEEIRFIQSDVTAGVAEITPELAKEILSNQNHGNRAIKKAHVKMLTTSLKSNEWMLNGESITFSESGRLLDGQHRLTACINSGKSFQTIVIKGIKDDDAFGTIDIGKPRSVADLMDLQGLPKAPLFSAIAKQHKAWIETENKATFKLDRRYYTERSIALHGKRYVDTIFPQQFQIQKARRNFVPDGVQNHKA